jgi:hypothetical protein
MRDQQKIIITICLLRPELSCLFSDYTSWPDKRSIVKTLRWAVTFLSKKRCCKIDLNKKLFSHKAVRLHKGKA